jgi:hypothetical protein
MTSTPPRKHRPLEHDAVRQSQLMKIRKANARKLKELGASPDDPERSERLDESEARRLIGDPWGYDGDG